MNAPLLDPTTTIIEQRSYDAAVSLPPGAEPVAAGAEEARYSVFTLQRQSAFLRNLELFGNVRHATRAACVSAQTAYRLRRQSPGFRLAWDAALLAARGHAEATLADRAIHGVEEAVYYHGEEVARRRRYDSRLLLAHLARLDRLEADDDVVAALARLDECIDALAEGVGIDATLAGPQPRGFSAQEGVPGVPSSRNGERDADADEELVGVWDGDDDGDGGEGEDADFAEMPELERRLQAMEAARPAEALAPFELAQHAAVVADSGTIEAAQLEAFEAGVPRWWELVPGDGADDAHPCDPASATHARGVSGGLLWEEERD